MNTQEPDITNHITQLRELTNTVKAMGERTAILGQIIEAKSQQVLMLRNLLIHVDQHLRQPRERNTPLVMSAIQRAIEITKPRGEE